MTKAQTDAEAIAAVKRALGAYADSIDPVVASAEHEMENAAEKVRLYVEQCRREVRNLEDSVRTIASAEEPDVDLLRQRRHELAGWVRKCAEATRLQAQLARDHEVFRSQQRRFVTALAPLVERGESRMRNAKDDVIRYERHLHLQDRQATRSWRTMTGSGTAVAGSGHRDTVVGTGGVAGVGATVVDRGSDTHGSPSIHELTAGKFSNPGELEVAGLPAGMVLAPIESCLDDGRVLGAGNYDAGKATLDECLWSMRTLYSEILPRMARGGDVLARLRDTDRGRGLAGNQSLEATFRGYFTGQSVIKLTMTSEGSYDVVNGAHRIWAARQLGMTHVPATVRRPDL